jgi:hypothetical protein
LICEETGVERAGVFLLAPRSVSAQIYTLAKFFIHSITVRLDVVIADRLDLTIIQLSCLFFPKPFHSCSA